MEEKKPLGFLVDENGDFSSGRLIKIVAAFASILMGIFIAVLALLKYVDTERIIIVRDVALALLALAGGAEIIQKSLNK